jgi:hypothetical protein
MKLSKGRHCPAATRCCCRCYCSVAAGKCSYRLRAELATCRLWKSKVRASSRGTVASVGGRQQVLLLPLSFPSANLLPGERKRRFCRRAEHLWKVETKIVASQSDGRSKRDAGCSVIVKEEEGIRGRSQLPERDAWRGVVGRRLRKME